MLRFRGLQALILFLFLVLIILFPGIALGLPRLADGD